MLRLPRIIIITFTLYMLLCIPAFAAQRVGGFVSNTPTAAGPDASIGEVWMKHGGARLQYDALIGSVQTYTNGQARRDPAAVKFLPPLYPQKKVSSRKVNKAKKATPVAKKISPATTAKPNPSPKPTLQTSSNDKQEVKAPVVSTTTNTANPAPAAQVK